MAMKIIRPESACKDCLRWLGECICEDICATCGHYRIDHAVLYEPSDAITEIASWHYCNFKGCKCSNFDLIGGEMAKETKHTATPWFVALSDNATPRILNVDLRFTHHDYDSVVHEHLICAMPAEIAKSYNSEANAKFIVRVCNAHDELVAALRGIKALLEPHADYSFCRKDGELMGLPDQMKIGCAVNRADEALAKATGGAE